MTLEPKFYTKLVSPKTRRRKQVRRSYRCESSRIVAQILNLISKREFRLLLIPKICMRPWIRSFSNISPKGPLRVTFLVQNTILSAQKALRVDFLAHNTILSAQKAPAGRLSSPNSEFACPKGPCGHPTISNYVMFATISVLGYNIWSLSLRTIVLLIPQYQALKTSKISFFMV